MFSWSIGYQGAAFVNDDKTSLDLYMQTGKTVRHGFILCCQSNSTVETMGPDPLVWALNPGILIYLLYTLYMMQGCHTPLPPPTPWYPPLLVKWVVVLFGLVAFPAWSCLASSPPPPVEWGLWSFWLAPPRLWGQCVLQRFYRGMVGLLPLVRSNVIVTCPPVGWGLWSFWLAPPRLCGAVCSTEIWYGCCRLLAVMSTFSGLRGSFRLCGTAGSRGGLSRGRGPGEGGGGGGGGWIP